METPMWKVLGWKRHTKRSLYGHHLVNAVCIDCGLTKEALRARFQDAEGAARAYHAAKRNANGTHAPQGAAIFEKEEA